MSAVQIAITQAKANPTGAGPFNFDTKGFQRGVNFRIIVNLLDQNGANIQTKMLASPFNSDGSWSVSFTGIAGTSVGNPFYIVTATGLSTAADPVSDVALIQAVP